MNQVSFRRFQPNDLEAIKRLTVECFEGVTIEQNLEAALGKLNAHDWKWRKARHLDEDAAANPSGIIVAEFEGRIVGYITTRIDREAGKGRIPNLAVAADFRGQGLGRALIEQALDYFRGESSSMPSSKPWRKTPPANRSIQRVASSKSRGRFISVGCYRLSFS